MILRKMIPLLSFFIATSVFATKIINIKVQEDDCSEKTVSVSADLTAEEAIKEALKQVSSIYEEDYEFYNLSVGGKPICDNEKMSDYTHFTWLDLRQI